ncbi:thyrotropin subunit beta-like [Hydractinia symbiolongicarpus]|uniref:thyrotropin subunit beta-like n=1 Tax=Hydractinia symbiolongicarpus TaxID=13093 RepID=UPI0025516FA5|nr:thyrotropin subunit beta-like [Hydractinia symbiolongicarpus]
MLSCDKDKYNGAVGYNKTGNHITTVTDPLWKILLFRMKNLLNICVFLFTCYSHVALSDTKEVGKCSPKKAVMKIYEPGCDIVTVKSFRCRGYCKSSSAFSKLNNTEELQVKCRYCEVIRYDIRSVQLSCPLHEVKTRTIEYPVATKCRCRRCSQKMFDA